MNGGYVPVTREPTYEELLQKVNKLDNEVLRRKQAERALRETQKALKLKVNTLKELNASLRVLLERREEDAKAVGEKMQSNVSLLLIPFLDKLNRTKLDLKQRAYLDVLQSTLSEIISPFSRELASKYASLTPTEIQIANLVKDGKTSKQIAEMMDLSKRTVESHRHNIREKLGLKRKGNLRSSLLSVK
jgi:DNA-binding CsgD family transcriptional regulator